MRTANVSAIVIIATLVVSGCWSDAYDPDDWILSRDDGWPAMLVESSAEARQLVRDTLDGVGLAGEVDDGMLDSDLAKFCLPLLETVQDTGFVDIARDIPITAAEQAEVPAVLHAVREYWRDLGLTVEDIKLEWHSSDGRDEAPVFVTHLSSGAQLQVSLVDFYQVDQDHLAARVSWETPCFEY